MSKKFNGIGASTGIAIAKVFKLVEPKLQINDSKIKDAENEIKKLDAAVNSAKADILKLQKVALDKLGPEKAAIFEAHEQILTDPVMLEETKTLIKNKLLNASAAFKQVADKYEAMFATMDDPYFKERASDVKDIALRVLKYLLKLPVLDLATINSEVIIVADDLTPSQTAQLDPHFVKGFACNMGGRTSHAAIMARSLEIPAVLGLKNIVESVNHDQTIIIDGTTGVVIVDPTSKEINEWETAQKDFIAEQKELLTYKTKSTISKDGKKFVLEGNIGSPKDVAGVLNNGGEGVGLFRTEFLYMDNDHFPTEEEQFQAYKAVLEGMGNKMVIIRTLDIGGDKKLSYFNFPKELNPFLGYRAIRLCLDKTEVFRTQLRALLRASVYGQLGIMFPMIATIDEFKTAKAILEEEKSKLVANKISVNPKLEVGMMMEIPAAAMIADKFAKYADFFSIGTNDLIQYNMAADRMSQYVAYLYQPFNPSILHMLNNIIQGAHQHKKWVGMCGEMAGDPLALPLLVGMGLDYYSMSATSILKARKVISKLDTVEMAKLVKEALNAETSEEVLSLVKKAINNSK